MCVKYDHEAVAVCRAAFLAGRAFDKSLVRPEVLASWQRCAKLRIPPAGLPGRNQKVPGRGGHVQRNVAPSFLMDELFTEFRSCLESMGASFYIVLIDGTVLYSGGRRELHSRLWKGHAKGPVSFLESCLGTTAVSLCGGGRTENWAVGAEHYLDALQDYATYASHTDSAFSNYSLCIVMPRAIFTNAFLGMIRYFLRLRGLTAELYQKKIELAKVEILFNQLKDRQEEALILVDYSQMIIRVNQAFENVFELGQDDVEGRGLMEIFPELESFTSCLFTGQSLSMSEVAFEGLPGKKRMMYATCSPWKKNGILNGMVIALRTARDLTALAEKNIRYRDAYRFEDMVGASPAFQEIKNMARSVADSNSSIILAGESGTGKELFAKAIHNASQRSRKPFVAVNCSAIPKELIGSELFGYGDGAFTGARRGGAVGKFEYANGGTLFLDEIAELPLEVQSVLLRVLEERTVTRIGTNAPIMVDVRIISATNKNLVQMVKDNSFRLDLYYRLNVISIELPPLRKRIDDIPPLVNFFLESIGLAMGKQINRVSREVMKCFLKYPWPGNVRQLRNVLERGINMTESFEIRLEDLPPEIRFSAEKDALSHRPVQAEAKLTASVDFGPARSYSDWEKERIWELMQKYRANKSRIASEMGISRGTLYKKIRSYGL